jgi:hypothetical protein
VRDWVLLILDEKARRHAAERPLEPEQGNGTKGSIDPLLRTPPEPEGCQRCGSTALFLDEARPVPMLTCGECLATRPAQAREERRAQICAVPDGSIDPSGPSLPARVALYLRALFTTATHNREARP